MSQIPPGVPPSEVPPSPSPDFPDYHPGESSKLAALRIAAILMIVFGSFAILGNLYFIASTSLQVAWGHAQPPAEMPADQQAGFYFGFYGLMVSAILAVPLLIVMLIGCVAMLRRRSLKWARVGAIMGIVPLTAGCCCILTLPFGIWALVLLSHPEVKASFGQPAAT